MFESPAQVLVNTVNTVGVMGKGIALTFKKLYPKMYNEYKKYCEEKLFDVGKLFLYKTPGKWILNFPTKKNWRNPSKMEYIELGLQKFVNTYKEKGIKSIAFPELGCGNGGLDFSTQVKPLMDKYLSNLDINVYVYLLNTNDKPEHLAIDDMKKWLNCNINNISSLEFINDIKDKSEDIAKVEVFDDYIIFNKEKIEYFDILAFWENVCENNIAIKSKLLDKYFSFLSKESLNKFERVLSKIEYISIDYKDIDGRPLFIYQPSKMVKGLKLC